MSAAMSGTSSGRPRSFEACSEGAANVDEIAFPSKGVRGLTLRLFDPQRHEWSLHWANSQTGVLFPPVVGRLVGDRGEFYGDDIEGRHPCPRPLHLVGYHPIVGSLGAGLLDRWRPDVGDQLDHGAHPGLRPAGGEPSLRP